MITINKIWFLIERSIRRARGYPGVTRINLCCGAQRIPGYAGIDFGNSVDIKQDLSRGALPFPAASMEAVTCISAINYFARERAAEIINEVYRVLRPGGVTRFAVQDMFNIAKRYISDDREFFFQKLPDGHERFDGPTIGDKFASWFYGYRSSGIPCQYFYDFESLAYLFKASGFQIIERKSYLESRLAHIELIDNRPDQMFFLEAIK